MPVPPYARGGDMAQQFYLQCHSNACRLSGRDLALHFFLPDLHPQYRDLHHNLPAAQIHEILRPALSERRLPHRAHHLDGSSLHLHAGYLQQEASLHAGN